MEAQAIRALIASVRLLGRPINTTMCESVLQPKMLKKTKPEDFMQISKKKLIDQGAPRPLLRHGGLFAQEEWVRPLAQAQFTATPGREA